MRANLIMVGGASLLFAFFIMGAPAEFTELWLDLRAANKVTLDQYDSTWMKFIMPRIGLGLLIIVAIQLAFTTKTGNRRRLGRWLR